MSHHRLFKLPQWVLPTVNVIDVVTFISSWRFSSLSTNGSAAYGTSRLSQKTGFVKGLSVTVASAWVQRPRLLAKTGEKRLSISSVWSVMALWVEDLDTALQIKCSGMSRRPSDSIKSSPNIYIFRCCLMLWYVHNPLKHYSLNVL